jgi:hypothetical protein
MQGFTEAWRMNTMKKSDMVLLTWMLVAIFSLPAILLAFTLNGADWTWQNDPMEEVFLVNPNCEDPEAGSPEVQVFSIIKGAEAWNNEGSSKFEFHYGGTTDMTGRFEDGYNLVFFSPQDGGDVIATTYYHEYTGDIVECDMKFWDGGWVFYGGVGHPPVGTDFDIWDIAAHEFGHYLSLGHTWQWQATMFATANMRETIARDLWDDDINGIHAIYGEPNINVLMTSDDSLTTVPAAGGSFGYSVQIKNNTSSAKTRTLWIDVVLPNGHTFGAVDGPVTVTVPAWATWNLNGFVQDIPDFAPAGVYCYNLKSSTSYKGRIESMTDFPFIKEASLGQAPVALDDDMPGWSASGWSRLAGMQH